MAALALSLVERRVNNKVVNYWPPFQDLYKQVKKCANYVCDKKNKRFEDYQKKLLINQQMDVIMINMPATTRVSGALLLIQDFLRSMHALLFYATKTDGFESICLARSQCKQLAEFEAIMRKAHLLGFQVQTDRPEVAAELPLLLTLLITHYTEDTEYEVVDTSQDWSPSTKFEDLPRRTMTICEDDASDDMPLMSSNSRVLVEKYIQSYEEYFGEGKVNPDRLLAQITHPFLGTDGFDELEILRPDDGKDLRTQAKDLLKNEILGRIKHVQTTSSTTEAEEEVDTATEAGSKSKLDRKKEMKLLRRMNAEKATTSNNLEERAEKAVNKFAGLYFDTEKELKAQYERMDKDPSSIDWEKVTGDEPDILYISSIFDVLEWWKSVGRDKHPLVYTVALSIIALPASNAFLERIFSTCTRFDDPLRNRLKAKRFEMTVLLAVNEVLLDNSGNVPTDEEAQNIVEKVISIFDKDPFFDAAIDLGIDPNDDDFQAKSDDEEEDN
jgi:hypothetical protein